MVSNLGRTRLRQNQAHRLLVVVAAKPVAAVRHSSALSLSSSTTQLVCVCPRVYVSERCAVRM